MHCGRRFPAAGALALFLVALSYGRASAQTYLIEAWTADDGLPQNSVNRVVQTRDGFIWLATFGGLARYDGARFDVFNKSNTPSLRSSRFIDLFEDRDGNLWAATEGHGVVRYRNGVFQTYYGPADGLVDNSAHQFFYDAGDRLLLDSPKGVVEWSATRFVPYSGSVPSESQPERWPLHRLPSGATWYRDRIGAHKFENGRVVATVPLDVDEKWVFQDRRGRLWIEYDVAGERHLMLHDSGHFTRFSRASGVPAFRTMSLFEDRDGGIWLSLHGRGGLLRFENGTFIRYTTADGLPSNDVGHLMQDREGTIWAPTEGGLASLRARVITAHSPADGLAADNTYGIHQTRSGRILIASWPGLTEYTDGVFRSIGDRYGMGNAQLMSLLEDRKGDLWVGAWGGLLRVRNGDVETFPPLRPGGDVVRALHEDRAGAIWVGGSSGLARYRDGTLTLMDREGFPGGAVMIIQEDRKGGLWIGTDDGLIEYRDGKFTRYGPSAGFPGAVVRAIYEDPQGVLWIGTYDSGLFRFAKGRFTRYTMREGLFDDGAFQILEDANANLWISSNSGIYRVSRRDLEEVAAGRARTVVSVSYGKRDGMRSAECNGGAQPAGIKAADGRLWFPTQKGVVVIDPTREPINRVPPPVVITNAAVDGQPVAPGDGLDIRPGQSAFEIRYAGLTFIRPELTRFRYKLEGLDDDWVDAGNRRTAYYTHVPYGTYRFVVHAANRDGVWSESPASIQVAVIAPFWRTRAFQAIVALALVGVLLTLYRRRIRAMERTQALHETFARQLIESQENERKRIGAELHDSLAQHLIIIKNWALVGARGGTTQDAAQKRLTDISSTASEALDEVREIARNLGPYQLDLVGLRQTILDMLERASSASGIRFTADVADTAGALNKTAEISLYRMTQESVNNIVKHSHATEAFVTLARHDGHVVLTVRDNGQGFQKQAAPGSRGETGFGLVGLHERARMIGGACVIDSAPGAGTRVEIVIPAGGQQG